MITAIGLNARQTCWSARCGVSRFAESSLYDKHLDPFTLASLPQEVVKELQQELPTNLTLPEKQKRMLCLANQALKEALQTNPWATPVPLYLSCPDTYGNRVDPMTEDFLTALSALHDGVIAVSESRLFHKGQAGGILALKEACQYLEKHPRSLALVGGVDTFVDAHILAVLDAEGRVSSEENPDGFIPGEGAGFLLIGTNKIAPNLSLEPLAEIGGIGTGFEGGHRHSEEVYTGDGLALAFSQLFKNSPQDTSKVGTVFCSMNGESLGAKEWGVGFIRHTEWFDEDCHVEHPADCFGDTGGSLGPILLGMAVESMKKEHRKNPCLVWCSSDYGDRGAVLVKSYKES